MTAAVALAPPGRYRHRDARPCTRCGGDALTRRPVPVCRECLRNAPAVRAPRYVPALGDVRAANCGGCGRTGACEWTARGWRCGRCFGVAL